MLKDNYQDHLYVLIIVGGGGTRLWPKSRNATPKQFLKLFKKRTLTEITAYRLRKLLPWERIFVITTSPDYKREILKEVPEILSENIFVEPARRNTAPAHALGTAYIHKQDSEAVIINGYVDHLIVPESRYLKTIKAAAMAAYSGDWLVAIGIKPSYPNVGYGYIKKGERWRVFEGKTVYRLERFTEKPKLKLAKKYLASGDYFWNAGQYIWRADSFLKALKSYAPKINQGLEKISRAIGTKNEREVIIGEYKRMPEVSVDYAISEKARNFLLLVADYRWTDIGDWKEVWENLPKDSQRNVVIDGQEPGGEIINIDTSDTLIHTDGRLIAIIDVDDVVVVDTKNALLVCSKSRAQNVKKIVQGLKKKKRKEFL